MSDDSPITQLRNTANKLGSCLHTKSYEEKFRLFVKLLNPTPSMCSLNVGASRPNCARRGLSLPQVQDYRRSFPGVKTPVFNGCALPFRDKIFHVVYPKAVIEHLADHYAQQRFAAEVVRVGRH